MKKEINFLIEFQEKTQFEYDKESNKINIAILKFFEELSAFKNMIKNYEKSPDYLKSLREMSEKMEDKFSTFKQNQMEKYEKILNEENRLSEDLDLFDQKIKEYDNIECERSFPVNSIKEHESNLNEEDQDEVLLQLKNRINKINKKLVEFGGRTCKWKDVDHNTFLKLKTKHKNNIESENFFNDCVSNIPIYTEEEIVNHIEAYKEYENLELSKKEIILAYNDRKYEIQQNNIQQNEEETINVEKNKRTSIKDIQKQREELEKKKASVLSWKAKKKSAEEVKKENEEKAKSERRLRQLEKEKSDLLKKKRAIQEFKEKKLLQQAEEVQKKGREKVSSRPTAEDLERIKQKEDRMVAKRLKTKLIKEAKKVEEEEKENRISEMKTIKFAYVEPKLTEATKTYESRKREKFDYKDGDKKYGDNFGGGFTRSSGRAIPSWRQDVL